MPSLKLRQLFGIATRRHAAWIAVLTSLSGLLLASGGAGCGAAPKVDPEASEKQYLLGADYFSKGLVRPALEELLKAAKLNPGNAEAQYLLGIVALRQASDAEAILETSACLKGEEAKLTKQEVDDHFREAERRFQLAIQPRPDYSEAWNGLAVVQLHFERWDEAISSTEKALSNAVYLQPWAAEGNLGWAWYQKREYPRAMKELREALTQNPQFCVGRYRMAQVLYSTGDLEAAAEELKKVTGDPKCPIQEAWSLLGLVSLKRGDRPEAERAFRSCVDLAPKSCLASECRIDR